MLREDNVRSSDDVVDIYDEFIRDCNPNDLGDERWMILEQVVVAGFDTHRQVYFFIIQNFTTRWCSHEIRNCHT